MIVIVSKFIIIKSDYVFYKPKKYLKIDNPFACLVFFSGKVTSFHNSTKINLSEEGWTDPIIDENTYFCR